MPKRYRPIVDRCYAWQPRSAPKSLDMNDINRIISMLIDISPELDDLRKIKRGLDGYLSVFDKEKRDDLDS